MSEGAKPSYEELAGRVAELEAERDEQRWRLRRLAAIDNPLVRTQLAIMERIRAEPGGWLFGRWRVWLRQGDLLRALPIRTEDLDQSHSLSEAIQSQPNDVLPIVESNAPGLAVLTGEAIVVPDIFGPEGELTASSRELFRQMRRSAGMKEDLPLPLAYVPLRAGGGNLGGAAFARIMEDMGPYSPQEIERIQAVVDEMATAVHQVRAVELLEVRNAELAEALEREQATSSVLRAISSSPSDLQAALDAIVGQATLLLDSTWAEVLRDIPGGASERVAVASRQDGVQGHSRLSNPTPAPDGVEDESERLPAAGVTMRFGGPQAIAADLPKLSALWREMGIQSSLGAVLVSGGDAFGRLVVSRESPDAYTPAQIKLFQTFADQAIIAIENARLFNELQERNREVSEALERQTALAQVLDIISRSPTDPGEAMAQVARLATSVCHAATANIQLFDGQILRLVATSSTGTDLSAVPEAHRVNPVDPGWLRTGEPIYVRDATRARGMVARAFGNPEAMHARSAFIVPLRQGERPLGVLTAYSSEVDGLSEADRTLLRAFADQAAIAVQNARLFNELQQRNREVSEALAREEAVAQISQRINKSPLDRDSTLQFIAETARALTDSDAARVWLIDGEYIVGAQMSSRIPAIADFYDGLPSRIPLSTRNAIHVAAAKLGKTIPIEDARAESLRLGVADSPALAGGLRSMVAVPIIREGDVQGSIYCVRKEVRPYSPREIAVLEAFAEQAALAMENARILNELHERNREVSEALERQELTGAVLEVVSSSPADIQL